MCNYFVAAIKIFYDRFDMAKSLETQLTVGFLQVSLKSLIGSMSGILVLTSKLRRICMYQFDFVKAAGDKLVIVESIQKDYFYSSRN